MAACIASIAECELDAVDFSCSDYPHSWEQRACELLAHLGLALVHVERPLALVPGDAFYIAHGESPRGLRHAVVYRKIHLVHDPHPDGGGIRAVQGASFLLPLAERSPTWTHPSSR